MPRSRTKWKILRVVYTAVVIYLIYRTLKFIEILYANYTLGSPMDLSDLMSEKDPRTFLEEYQKFRLDYVPFDFHEIAAQNEKLLQQRRKEFIRQSIDNYGLKLIKK